MAGSHQVILFTIGAKAEEKVSVLSEGLDAVVVEV